MTSDEPQSNAISKSKRRLKRQGEGDEAYLKEADDAPDMHPG
jgi:hypothetical protein